MYLYMTSEAEFDKLCPFGSVYTHHQLCLLPPPQHPIFPMSNLALSSKFKMHTHFGQEIPFLGLWARVPLTQI